MTQPTVAIVGVPNVGKSTLFNRLVGRRRALVGSRPGMTRDRIHAEVRLDGRRATLVDTGGIFADAGEGIGALVRAQAQVALDEADVILFLVSVRDGPTPADRELAALLRKSGRAVLLVANKVDHEGLEPLLGEMYGLGLGDPLPVAAEHGLGISELVAAVLAVLPDEGSVPEDPEDVRALAIVGRTNVGKSSLLNALVKEERAIVSETPGTTRDSIDLCLEVRGSIYRMVDTAGIRRGARRDATEQLSTMQATRSLAAAAVALLVLDGSEGITTQDLAVAGLARRHRRPFVILVNKWDLRAAEPEARESFRSEIARRLLFARYAPSLFISARTGLGLGKIFPQVEKVWESGGIRIGTGRLNRFVQRLNEQHTGRTRDGAPMRILYLAQTGVHPPRFAVFTNRRVAAHFSYRRFLENRLREEFQFEHTPMVLDWRLR